jgi:hypothetical protein
MYVNITMTKLNNLLLFISFSNLFRVQIKGTVSREEWRLERGRWLAKAYVGGKSFYYGTSWNLLGTIFLRPQTGFNGYFPAISMKLKNLF